MGTTTTHTQDQDQDQLPVLQEHLENLSGEEVREIKVYRTDDLSQFKMMSSNRAVSRLRVRKIANELLSGNDLLRHYPIQVTKDGYVIDGQHRLEAAKLAQRENPNICIYFLVRDTLSDDMHKAQATMSVPEMMMIRHNVLDRNNWGYVDFLNFWSDKGLRLTADLLEGWDESHEKSLSNADGNWSLIRVRSAATITCRPAVAFLIACVGRRYGTLRGEGCTDSVGQPKCTIYD